ncbi:MAG: ImmA/IrrE family metallo-endopeptidase, partial [Elusimicrobia bacterium]|nr:ImmA/IrrE family metallo-endopeptidase [Elusimicrobiota bacterium]
RSSGGASRIASVGNPRSHAHEARKRLRQRRRASGSGCRGPGDLSSYEQTANAFAAELLVPESGLEQFDYSPLTPSKLKRICDHYEVGHTVVANRLNDLGKVSRVETDRALDGLFTPGRSNRKPRRR